MTCPFVDIHTHNFREDIICFLSLEVGESVPELCENFTRGVHPWRPSLEDVSSLDLTGVKAVGEIGLDYSLADFDKQLQMEVFTRQLALAKKYDLPVVIHCVKAFNDVLAQLKLYDIKHVIFHSFTGSLPMVKSLVELGCYISLSDRSLFSVKTINALKEMSEAKILLETDESFCLVEQIYDSASEKLGIDLDTLKERIFKNYKTIFYGEK
ncbi:MAG: TatD family hydrolase [Rikenellaceae bacterium]